MTEYHIAQINIGRMNAPTIDDPIMADFVAWLEPLNAVADTFPGFVWRLQTEDGDATSLQVFDDNRIIVNMSVWENIDTLFDYVYKSVHVEALQMRSKWFEHFGQPFMTMWWVEAGHIPTVKEAKTRLAHIEAHGPTPLSFTFRQRFTVAEYLAFNQQD